MPLNERREINAGRAVLERLVLSFGMQRQLRFTMDAPIRTSVWSAYADDPQRAVPLLLVPHMHVATRQTVELLIERLGVVEIGADTAGVLALSTSIQVSLAFREMIGVVVPMTPWWDNGMRLSAMDFIAVVNRAIASGNSEQLVEEFRTSPDKDRWRLFAIAGLIGASPRGQASAEATHEISALEQWQFVGRMADIMMRLGDGTVGGDAANGEALTEAEMDAFTHHCMAPALRFLDRLDAMMAEIDAATSAGDKPAAKGVWSININRPVDLATWRSHRTVKADAAVKLFGDPTDGIAWAVIDSGIDATHPAFAKRVPDSDGTVGDKVDPAASRIAATYDFTRLRHLVRNRYAPLISDADHKLLARRHGWTDQTGDRGKRGAIFELLYARYHAPGWSGPTDEALDRALENDRFRLLIATYAETLKRDLELGRMIDWALVAPLIAVPHTVQDYMPPENGHGTHVAGILAGDWPEHEQQNAATATPVRGVCPRLALYDFRVCDGSGRGEEFAVQAALQFVGYLNRNRDQRRVHGVNVSLAIRHDVTNYACGQTPVCTECERLTGEGTLVVAAAGNEGFHKQNTENGLVDAYNAISISDPGNAESVVTVGATHGLAPHGFGVSYFSSRGPTGDGREKPDLVAPGEKIRGPVPGPRTELMDGTSMAAPHVSGVAALLMGRHRELIGRPSRIKEILCASATDLGRRREFQGAGLVDALRALQSV